MQSLLRWMSVCTFLLLSAIPAIGQDELRLVRAFEPQSLDPHKAGTWEYHTLIDLFEGLTATDASGSIIPGMAESWTISPDGLTYLFRLRPEQKWSDGHPLDSTDIIWSLRRSLAPVTGNQVAYSLKSIRNAMEVINGNLPGTALAVSAPDARSVRFELAYPDPSFLEALSTQAAFPVPRHIVDQKGDAWAQTGTFISNGAYRLLEAVPNSHVRLERNPFFHDASAVMTDLVTYYPLDDNATALKRYRGGELDVLSDFPLESLPQLRRDFPDEIRITPAIGLQAVMVNTRKPPLNDVRVRRALSLLLDRDAIADKLLQSGERGAYSYTPPHLTGYAPPRIEGANMDRAERVKKATALAAEAGITKDKPIRLVFRYTTNRQSKRVAIAIASMLREIGVTVELVNTESRVTLRDYKAGNFDLAMYQFSNAISDPIEFLEPMLGRDGYLNLSGYNDPAFDALLTRARQTQNPAQRADLLAQAEMLALAAVPYLPLYHIASRSLVSPKIKGWVDNAGNLHPSRYISITP
ncbi:ABC transporter substrate-binding protein [Asticcacaulis sp.]|uniref:peptide ABC transporter substrate-binding protein n=1 Tax=Asticcacaulis sp. TaxID=1872648 RepID=UPI00262B9907|nr:peptide ABC transporter substrate-binding protein [Asticcacaulis sp.]